MPHPAHTTNHDTVVNPLNMKYKLFCLIPSSFRAVNTFLVGYKKPISLSFIWPKLPTVLR